MLGYLPGAKIPPGRRKCLERTATETWIAERRSRTQVVQHPQISFKKRSKLLKFVPGPKLEHRGLKSAGTNAAEVSVLKGRTREISLWHSPRHNSTSANVILTSCAAGFLAQHWPHRKLHFSAGNRLACDTTGGQFRPRLMYPIKLPCLPRWKVMWFTSGWQNSTLSHG